ncbi:ion channel [Aerolutibacter ruishenii]|uniref:Ion channel n=1 Tax=Aerolutibacter ruishenii TaxID=686800 RepID=A0A562LRY8_9GAMM|nr:ion channel [Lysobacter ruishenii]TWI10376.1 ion channel [Lysobacter ruishenii]
MGTQDLRYRRWRVIARRHPSAFLLAAQLASLVTYPLLEGDTGRVLFGAFGVVIAALAVWVVMRSPAVKSVAWIIAVPAVLLSVIAVLSPGSGVGLVATLLEASLYFYAAASLTGYMLSDHRVTSDELFAAGATFTLLMWAFAYAFVACQSIYPDAFTGVVEPERPRTWMELLFLSATNLSATGLGDVLPIHPAARVLVVLEQICGVGYLAVVVSRLIGLTVAAERRVP